MKSLKILAVGPWYPNSAFRYLTDALAQDGHSIIRCGPDYNNPYEIVWAEEYKVSIDILLPRESVWNLGHFLDVCTARENAPDLIFASEETYHNPILTTNKVPMVLYSVDGWPENFERVEMYQPTLAYMEDPLGIRSYRRTEQDPRWRFLPGAAAPWVHHDLGLTRDTDFYFCGSMYVNRPILCEYLRSKGHSVNYGKADTGQYVHNLSTTLATLHDCNGEDRVKWRFFEGMACGCVMISDYTQLLDWLGYRPWEHYLPVQDVMCELGEPAPDMAEVESLLSWIKSHSEEAHAIAERGKEFTLAHHTYTQRADTIIQDLVEKNAIG